MTLSQTDSSSAFEIKQTLTEHNYTPKTANTKLKRQRQQYCTLDTKQTRSHSNSQTHNTLSINHLPPPTSALLTTGRLIGRWSHLCLPWTRRRRRRCRCGLCGNRSIRVHNRSHTAIGRRRWSRSRSRSGSHRVVRSAGHVRHGAWWKRSCSSRRYTASRVWRRWQWLRADRLHLQLTILSLQLLVLLRFKLCA